MVAPRHRGVNSTLVPALATGPDSRSPDRRNLSSDTSLEKVSHRRLGFSGYYLCRNLKNNRNRPVVAVLTCSMGRSVGEKCPHKKYVDTYAKCVGVAGAMFQGSRSAMQFTG